MSNLHISPPKNPNIHAHIKLPASKSLSNRALVIAALCQQPCTILHLADADDTRLLKTALNNTNGRDDVGAGGTTLRFLTAYRAVTEGTWELSGTNRLHERPIADLVDALRNLGADIEYINTDKYPPLRIKGKALRGGEISIKADVSSQFISALLLIAPTFAEGLVLHLQGEVVSKPYITMTLNLMQYFGIQYHWEQNTITIRPQTYQARTYTVEADWSAASYFYAATALAPEAVIFLEGLAINQPLDNSKICQERTIFSHPHHNTDNIFANQSLQGDSVIADIAAKYWQINSYYTENGVQIVKLNTSNRILYNDLYPPPMMTNYAQRHLPIHLNANAYPDLVQTIAVVHAALHLPTIFTGLQTLKHKETDRIAALDKELQKSIAYQLFCQADKSQDLNTNEEVYTLQPQSISDIVTSPPQIATYNDHRMAMAFAPLAWRVPMGIIISNSQVITKSYPNFWQDWATLGFVIQPC